MIFFSTDKRKVFDARSKIFPKPESGGADYT